MEPKLREEALSNLYWRRWIINFFAFLCVGLIFVFRETGATLGYQSSLFLVVMFHSYAETNGKIRILLLATALSEKDPQRETRG